MEQGAAAAAVGSAVHMSKAPTRVPIFPLAGALLFPRAQLPLHVFEERYRALVRDAIAGANRIAMIQPSAPGDPQPLFAAGCLGDIVGVEELEDGRFNLVLQGAQRFRLIAEVDAGTLYRQADVDLSAFDDREPEPLPLAMRSAVEEEARRFGEALRLVVDWDAVGQLDDELLVNAIAQVAPFDVAAKQALLEEPDLVGRAGLVVQLMQFQRIAPGGADTSQTMQ